MRSYINKKHKYISSEIKQAKSAIKPTRNVFIKLKTEDTSYQSDDFIWNYISVPYNIKRANEGHQDANERAKSSGNQSVGPYIDKLVADGEWLENYREKNNRMTIKELQQRLDGTGDLNKW